MRLIPARAGAAAGVLVAALAALAAPAGAATSCPGADAPPELIGTGRAASVLGCLVNHERQAAGLGPIVVERHAAVAAQGHAVDMAVRAFFEHTNPDGVTFDRRLTNAGLDWGAAAENIARGQDTARDVMAAWLASPKHCHALMASGYTVAGYGVHIGVHGPWWVQEFARPTGVPVPTAVAVPCPRTPAQPQPAGALDGPPDDSAFSPSTPPPAPGPGRPTAPAQEPDAARDDDTAASPASPAPTGRPRLRAAARRSGRTLRLRVALPAATASPARVVVRVTQRGRTARTLTARRTPGRSHVLRLRLARADDGRAVVRVGGRTASARFR